MRGYILHYDEESQTGVINSQDNQQRYNFSQQDWRETSTPVKGMEVDFLVGDFSNAIEIYSVVNFANKAVVGLGDTINMNKVSSKKNFTTFVYIMYVFGLLSVGFFAIIGLVLAYWKKAEFVDSIYHSHLSSLIRVFWWGLFWFVFGGLLLLTIVGIPVTVVMWLAAYVWIIYRLVDGLIKLSNEQAV